MKSPLSTNLNLSTGTIDGFQTVSRTLSELSESFADRKACEAALKEGNPVIYTVTPVKPAEGDGQLHYGLGTILPGKIGDEYFLTKGHVHQRREAAEVYIGLKGRGVLLLENIQTGESSMHDLAPNSVVYVAIVQVGDSILHPKAGEEIWISAGTKHRLSSAGPNVRVLEVAFGNWQQGDITRYEDDYQRLPEGE